LVQKARSGDREAFEELVRLTGRLVFSRIYLETGDRDRTEDLAQETYLRAFRSLAQVTEPKGFRTWLLAIAHSVVVDAFRREGRKKRTGAPAGQGATASPSEALEANEHRERALSVLRSLPEEYRTPLMLRYLGGADYETIGRQLGLSNGSLRGLLNRGMALLRSQVKEAKAP
jgi:RNA polymerase sigma-70 factor (ECF subfamily)